jgi:hypothetical protein
MLNVALPLLLCGAPPPSCRPFQQAGRSTPFGRWGQTTHVYRAEPAPPPYDPERSLDCTGLAGDGVQVGHGDPAALAKSLPPDHCADPESEERLPERGWVVLRGLATRAELGTISGKAKVASLCQPILTDTAEGRRACAFSAAEFRARMPALTDAIGGVLANWTASGVAASAGLGGFLGLPPRSDRVSRLVQITTASTYGALRRSGASGERYYADWHIDNHGSTGMNNAHRILLMVHKKGDADTTHDHANVCMASTAAVDRCDSPGARQLGTEDPFFWKSVWETVACCPSLEPGDAVFYREEVAHRTQDQAVDRLSMVITIDAGEPTVQTAEDVRCGGWAAAGRCDSPGAREFMWCGCAAACRREGAVPEDEREDERDDEEGNGEGAEAQQQEL